MSAKAKELKSKGHSAREISQEMHLSQATVEWLLAKQASDNFTDNMPADVKVGWRTIGVSGTRMQAVAGQNMFLLCLRSGRLFLLSCD